MSEVTVICFHQLPGDLMHLGGLIKRPANKQDFFHNVGLAPLEFGRV
jgi:hypothetical protein